MTRTLQTGNGAAAWGARLAQVDYIPAFPITPQTEIIETLSAWISKGQMDARLTMLESEHSMLTAAGAAAATGARVFTATSSQGLLYGFEMLYNIAGWRVPLVVVNVSRALAAPVTLEPDHCDVLAARDSGCLQIHCSTVQEVTDSVLMAYRLAEHRQVRLPVIVNLDGFYLSFTREPCKLVDDRLAADFVGAFDRGETFFSAKAHRSQAVAVLGGSMYSYFRYQAHLAQRAALDVYDEVAAEFEARFGRLHRSVETYRLEDAELAIVMLGSFATKAKEAVDVLRNEGWRVGLLRPRLLRPFPDDEIRRCLGQCRAVAVIDQNISLGKGGVLFPEIASALYGPTAPLLLSFIGGLGGRDLPVPELVEVFREARRAAETGRTPPPRLMFTEDDLLITKKAMVVAGAAEGMS